MKLFISSLYLVLTILSCSYLAKKLTIKKTTKCSDKTPKIKDCLGKIKNVKNDCFTKVANDLSKANDSKEEQCKNHPQKIQCLDEIDRNMREFGNTAKKNCEINELKGNLKCFKENCEDEKAAF